MEFTRPELADVRAAAARIAPFVRRTPLLQATATHVPLTPANLWLKLECLQPTGSFKVRGATNRLLMTPETDLRHGIVTASGGNHGLAVARVAAIAGVQGTIFVPDSVRPDKLEKLEALGASVRVVGQLWDEANRAAIAFAAERGAAYFHPFADPAVIAGQGTVALEILDDLPDLDVLLVAIGGGGLMAGIACAIQSLKPSVRLVGVEPVGAPTLKASRDAGQVVTLPEITTRVATMACGRTDENVFEIVNTAVEKIVLVSDAEMLDAARLIWREFGLAADLSGAAAIAALRTGAVQLEEGQCACALVCGAGSDALS